MSNPVIDIKNIEKTFMVGAQEVHVLKNISFSVLEGDFLVIFGPSGCGKSTLLHIILGLENPSEGNVTFLGQDFYTNKAEDERSSFRKEHVGMVYQQANWIKSLKVGENVAFPLVLLGQEKSACLQKAKEILQQVELADWFEYVPTELSSGQQQRISLARALINDPEVIIADEPTGNLDFKSGQEMMELLARLNQTQKKTVIMVTHDLEYLKFANRAVQMLDGQVVRIFEEKDKSELMSGLQFKRAGDQHITQNLDKPIATSVKEPVAEKVDHLASSTPKPEVEVSQA